MKTTLILLAMITCIAFTAHAQVIIKGRITNLGAKPVTNASVTLRKTSETNIESFTYSTPTGNYELSYTGPADTLELVISGMNIERQTKMIPNKNQIINFTVKEKTVQLKEVVVKSTQIWGTNDTINYRVAAFSTKSDIVIGDVLKKMPGIAVDENGGIKFQGKAINKFYIENLDMLQGRYGIATNNISAKDVSTVQVLQDHQPVKALKDIKISTEAAINLKLKDGVKGTLSIMAQLGIGANPLLWDNELAAMYFAKKKQNMTTYKTNNTGKNLTNELRSFTTSNRLEGGNLVHIQIPSTPQINEKRYLFNNSNAATVNNLMEFRPGKQLNFNLIYLNDHEKRESTTQTTYYLPGDSILIIDEKLHSGNNTDKIETEIRYNINDPDYYLNNYINVEGTWEKGTGEIANNPAVQQQLYLPSFFASNTLNVVKRNKQEKGYNLVSFTGFRTKPQTLTVYGGLSPHFFNDQKEHHALQQDVRLNTFQTNNRITMLSVATFNRVKFNPDLAVNIESQQLNSDLHPLDNKASDSRPTPDSLKNDLNRFKADVSLSAGISYQFDKIKLDLQLPLNYTILYLYNRKPNEKQNSNYLFFQPSLSAQYKLKAGFEINATYRLFNPLGDIQTTYPGYILQNYRRLNAYDGQLSKAQVNQGGLNFSYNNMMHAFFFDITTSYQHTKRNILYGQNFMGIVNMTSSVEQSNVSESASISARLSKGLNFLSSVLSLEGSYGKYSSEQLLQNKLVNYINQGHNVSATLFMKPLDWMDISYKSVWGESSGKLDSGAHFPAIRSALNTLNFNLNPVKNTGVNIDCDYYYNNSTSSNKYMRFMDMGIWHTWKNMRFTLDWSNIFDTKNYVTVYYNDISAYRNRYVIRPASILLKVKFKLK